MDARSWESRFVGRQAELEEIRRVLARAVAGGGSGVHISGEPGIGKTRLLTQTLEAASAEGWEVLSGRGYDFDGYPPYLPFVEALMSCLASKTKAEIDAHLEEAAGPIAAIFPEVAARFEMERKSDLIASPPGQYQRFESVAQLLRSIGRSAKRGLLLAIDDLHWTDPSTLLLFRHCARRLSDAPVAFLTSSRIAESTSYPELNSLLSEVCRDGLVRLTTLQPLSLSETEQLTQELVGIRPSDGAIAAIYRRSRGNPLFVQELVRDLVAGGHDLTSSAHSMGHSSAPEGIVRLLRAQFHRLGESARAVLTAGSVIGENFPHRVLESTVELSSTNLLDGIDEAIASGLILDDSANYWFRHPLVREAVYALIPPGRRARLHRLAGQRIESLYADDLEPHLGVLAEHYSEAARDGEGERAVAFAHAAGERAARVLAYEEAARLFSLALHSLEFASPVTMDFVCSLQLQLAEMQRKAGDLRGAMHTYAEVARRSATRQPEIQAEASLGYEAAYLLTGLPRAGAEDESLLLQRNALAAVNPAPSRLRVRLLASLAQCHYFSGERVAADELSIEAVESAGQVGNAEALASALRARRLVLAGPDRLLERLEVASHLLQLGENAHDLELQLDGSNWRAMALLELGDIGAVRVEVERFAKLANSLRQPYFLSRTAILRALLLLLEGRFREASVESATALTLGRQSQTDNAILFATIQALVRAWWQDDQEELGRIERQVDELTRQYAPSIPSWWANNAILKMALGRRQQARQSFDRLARHEFREIPRDALWLGGIAFLTEVCAWLDDRQSAPVLERLLLPHRDQQVVTEAVWLGPVTYYLGLLKTMSGSGEVAVDEFECALQASTAVGSVPMIARSKSALAGVLLKFGGRANLARARQLLREARDARHELGLEIQPTDGPANHIHPIAVPSTSSREQLTPRETEVIALLVDGNSNAEIAAALVLSTRTVEHHLANIYAKLGVHDRRSARKCVEELGWMAGRSSP